MTMTMNEQNPNPPRVDPPSQGEEEADLGSAAAAALPAATIYLLMTKEYRISRNRRAEWYFNHLNSIVTMPDPESEHFKQLENSSVDLEIVSVVPASPPPNWNSYTSHSFRYKVTCETVVIFLSWKYRIVYCLDVSPSAASVDVQSGIVILDGMFEALRNSTSGLMMPFYVPGSRFLFRPKIYISVIAHGSFLASTVEQVIVQGILLEEKTYDEVLQMIFEKLHAVENCVAEVTTYLHETSGTDKGISEPKGWEGDDNSALASAMSPDFGLVDLLRQALIALNLLPQESTAGLIIVTDGVINVPDGGYLDKVLSQFRYNTVACSFIQLSSPFHPHVTYGSVAYVDLLRFIAVATCGAYLTIVPRIGSESSEINPYHEAFLEWSFQKSTKAKKSNPFAPSEVKPGEWSVRNKCFSSVRDMPIVKKHQSETTLVADFKKIISSRLREGFIVKAVIPSGSGSGSGDNQIQIVMSLHWKFLINIEYAITTTLQAHAQAQVQAQAQQKIISPCTIVVHIEGPYDFIHDVTCLAKTQHQSYYRQLLVTGFWATLKQLDESDKLLVHFDQFTTSPSNYAIPESLKKGLPLFSISTKSKNTSSPFLQPSDFAPPAFANFWRAVCSLDRSIWEKFMHTHNHQIQFILSPDTHFEHKHLHIPNSSGRYHVIQCRQTLMSLNTLLKDWCSFVLVENHSYIRLMADNEKPPFSFCIVRITTKPPCVVLRIAFLVGTPGQLRNQTVNALRDRIARITFPQRLNEPPKWRMVKPPDGEAADPDHDHEQSQSPRALRKTWSDMPASIVLETPIEKMLIRYEVMPKNFFRTLLPQHHYNTWTSATRKSKTNQASTFGFNPTYTTPWGPTMQMGPEMFNTMARYFHHRRWIWCVQNHSLSTPTLDCAALILSTITKMRLQEGLRFAYSSGGAINMVKELKMKITEGADTAEDDENRRCPNSNDDICSCVLQYVIFPPVTSLCNADDDEDEGSLEEEDSEMYLITECWVEPQYGKVISASENVDFENLTYSEIPAQFFQIDQECISTLLTFEHLSLMCQNPAAAPALAAAPAHASVTTKSEPTKVKTDGEGQIKYIPFNFEVSRILPRSRQAELLFSMFNQNLQLNFRNGSRGNGRIQAADRANVILFNAWISSVTHLHDREVILEPSENKRIFQLIKGRKRDGSKVSYSNPISNLALNVAASAEDYPKWRCFTKWVSSTHIIATLFPASYADLMSLMLPPNDQVTGSGSVAVNILNDFVRDPCEGQGQGQLELSALGSKNSTADTTPNHSAAVVLPSAVEPRSAGQFWPRSDTQNYFFPEKSSSSLRKRLRVKSGGDLGGVGQGQGQGQPDGPCAAKKSLIRKSSLDNLYLVKNFCAGAAAAELPTPTSTRRKTLSGPSRDYDIGGQGQGESGEIAPEKSEKEIEAEIPGDVYGSVTLPVYVFDCSLSALHDHIIFRNCGPNSCKAISCASASASEEDIYTDCRFNDISSPEKNKETESESVSPWGKNLTRMMQISPKHKSQSPEPKSADETDLPPSNKEILRRHCGALEASFSKSYVLGLFESLQRNQFIQPHDVQIAISLCEETKVSVDLSEFIEALCSHVKDAKQEEKENVAESDQNNANAEISKSFVNYETCANLEKIQEFIKEKFQEIILSTFQSVTECPGIYFFKFDSHDLKFINRSNAAATTTKDISTGTRFLFSSSNMNAADSISSSQFLPQPEPRGDDLNLMETSGEQELYDAFVYTTDEPNSPVESENDAAGPAPEPVLLYLTCVYKQSGGGDDPTSNSIPFLVHQIPTCIEEIVEALEIQGSGSSGQGSGSMSGSFNICKSKVDLKIEFVFLTVPKFKERIDYEISPNKSKVDVTPPPSGETETATMVTTAVTAAEESLAADIVADTQNQLDSESGSSNVYPSVPWNQLHCIEKTIQDVRWLIQDEITCFSSEKIPLGEETLAAVISHVEQSVDKPGCQLIRIPLLFVDNSQPLLGYEKFKERFQGLRAYGYELKEKGSLYYLMNQKDTLMECLGRISTSRAQMVEAQASDVFDTEELDSLSLSVSQAPTPSRKISGQENNAAAIAMAAVRLRGKQISGDPTSVDSLSMSAASASASAQAALMTSCQQSERSSIITNEDGYEGDGSESEREGLEAHTALGQRSRSRNVTSTKYNKCPTFWMIFKLTPEQINAYFQCRCNENEMEVFENSTWICQRIVKLIHSLKRIVNQDLLLQQLHDKRFCSELLEPDDEEDDDFMEGYSSRPELPLYTGPTMTTTTSSVYPNPVHDPSGGDLAANFTPGSFSCRVVGEFRLFLHPRLRIGPGKSLMSRGIQTIKATLIAFEISNRRNMFVYRDRKGNDFYLRLYRLESRGGVKLSSPTKSDENLDTFGASLKENETLDEFRARRGSVSERELSHSHTRQGDRDTETDPVEDIVLLQVCGITEAGQEIKENLVQSLQNKLDDSVLDILSVMLDRNPHCKLTPEDVHFIQKPKTPADTIIKYHVNDYGQTNLSAFNYYLNQNLLQFSGIPRYMDFKPENHFQDYPPVLGISENEIPGRNIHLYNQSPGETGSRGIACIAVNLVNPMGSKVMCSTWARPSSFAHAQAMEPNAMDKFYSLIQAEEVENGNGNSAPPSKVMVEFRVWKQGRISIDLLKGNLSSAIKNTMWDLLMEFSFLTAPIAFDNTVQPAPELENLLEIPIPPHVYSASRFNKFETGETGHLHPILANSMREWSEFGNRLNVPSLRIVPISLPYRQAVDLMSPDLEKLISSVLHENLTKIFWKDDKGQGQGHGEIYYTSSALIAFSEDKRLEKRKLRSHFFELDDNCKTLDGFEDLNEIDYPNDLMGIFQDAETFDPASLGHESIIVSRHLRSWRACVHGSTTEGFTFCPEEKSLYKFPPLLAGGTHAHSHSSRDMTTPRGSLQSEGPLTPGVGFPILVPRQRLLMVTVTNSQISFIFYNWSKESSLRLIEITKNYTQWICARTAVASSIFAQKSGLFHNQPIDRPSVDNPFTCGGIEVETLLANTIPPREQMQIVPSQPSRVNFHRTTNRTKSPKLLAQFLESFRNVEHQSTVLRIPGVINNNAKFLHGQVLQLKSLDRTEMENILSQNWGAPISPRGSNSPRDRDVFLSLEALEVFKKVARRVHFCLTPILFLKRWRIEVATTRDGTIGTVKKGQGRHLSDSKRSSQRNLKPEGGVGVTEERSRHGSGASEKSFEVGSIGSRKPRSSIWGLFSTFNSQKGGSGGDNENMPPGGSSRDGSGGIHSEKWHSALLENFVEEYIQYLQTLGFNRINLKNSTGIAMKRGLQGQDQRLRNMSGTSLMSTTSSQSGGSLSTSAAQGQGQGQRIGSNRDLQSMGVGVGVNISEKTYYLQKVLPGGVILLDLSFADPFFYVNIYSTDMDRIQGQGQTRKMKEEVNETDYKNALNYLEECDQVKDSMHLHSFAFDFHLRSAQSYICGRQLLPPGFHLTHFFDDFIKYYPKHPNFARNTVHTGNITVQNIATPSHILYDYILTHKMLYNMKVVQINSSADKELNEYILVQSSTKKIIYKDLDADDAEDDKQFDEFDLSLLVAHDAPIPHYSADPSVLRLKYYIVLTSRQELYPKLEDEGNKGKFGTVNAQNSICQPKRLNFAKYQTNPAAVATPMESAVNSRRGSVEEPEGQGQGQGSEAENPATEAENLEQELRDMAGNDHPFAGKSFYDGIREEKVHYMGYFSSHEQSMQEILQEQVGFVESSLLEIVEMAAVDCRRDLLWQRLLVGGKFPPPDKDKQSKRDDLIARETVGPLTIWDFRELLSFLHVKSLSVMDQRVASLLKQPISFYQSLLRLITVGNLHSHRYFVAPDNSIHQMAIFTPSVSRSVVMLEINLEKRTSDLSVIFKELNTSEEPIVLEPEILNLIESVINACCYCSWANMV